MTDHEGSLREKSNVLDRELNLTEYERNVRAANGLPSSGGGSQHHLGSFVSAQSPKRKVGSIGVDVAPKFGDNSQAHRSSNAAALGGTFQEQHLARLSGPADAPADLRLSNVGKSAEFQHGNPAGLDKAEGNGMTIEMNGEEADGSQRTSLQRPSAGSTPRDGEARE